MFYFYNPKTLKIMGASNAEISMDFPYVESDIEYHSLGNLAIEIKNKKPELFVKNGSWEKSIYQ